MTEQDYELTAEALAIAIWETSTNNGLGLDEDYWDDHMTNCQAAVANSYTDEITEKDWHAAALAIIRTPEQPAD
jgi:hypothetical protein